MPRNRWRFACNQQDSSWLHDSTVTKTEVAAETSCGHCCLSIPGSLEGPIRPLWAVTHQASELQVLVSNLVSISQLRAEMEFLRSPDSTLHCSWQRKPTPTTAASRKAPLTSQSHNSSRKAQDVSEAALPPRKYHINPREMPWMAENDSDHTQQGTHTHALY